MHFVDPFIDVPVTTEPILVIQPVLNSIQPFFSTVINHRLIQSRYLRLIEKADQVEDDAEELLAQEAQEATETTDAETLTKEELEKNKNR